MSDVTGSSTPGAVPESAPPAVPEVPPAATAASPLPTWSSLDPAARMVAGAGIAAVVVLLIGGVVGAWPSTEFLLIALAAAVIAAGAAWLHSMIEDSGAQLSIPGPIVGVLAGVLLVVLAVWNAIELLFDLDELSERGVIAPAAIVALAVVAAVLFVATVRRAPEAVAAVRSSATPSRLALAGLVLVLIGWGLNLASYWTMNQATRSLALLTLAAAIILLAGRGLPALAAWVGAVLGLLAALVALGHWGQLQSLGEDRLKLGITDFLPFLLYALGVVLIIVAGVLAGMAARPVVTPPATPPAPEPGNSAG